MAGYTPVEYQDSTRVGGNGTIAASAAITTTPAWIARRMAPILSPGCAPHPRAEPGSDLAPAPPPGGFTLVNGQIQYGSAHPMTFDRTQSRRPRRTADPARFPSLPHVTGSLLLVIIGCVS